MVILMYVLIVFVATFLGAAVGLGGGVIIKPCFDLINMHNTATIGVYSAMAVFTMSIVSIYKQYKNKAKFELPIVVTLAIGSILGGFSGDFLFSFVNEALGQMTKVIQNGCLAVVLSVILVYTLRKDKIRTLKLTNPMMIFLIGFLLGNISVFLGIGGGPLNLAVLSFFFSFTSKESVVLSIVIIFFSQGSKLTTTFIKNQFMPYDLSVVPFILIAAVIGGIVGSTVNKKMNSHHIDILYISTLVLLVVLALYNMFSAIL